MHSTARLLAAAIIGAIVALTLSPAWAALVRRFDGIHTGVNGIVSEGPLTVERDTDLAGSLNVKGNTALRGAVWLGMGADNAVIVSGRLIIRELPSDPLAAEPATRPAGSPNELAVRAGRVYLCTSDQVPTWILVGPPGQ